MKTDRELLELAAKAAGINLEDHQPVLARDGKSYLPPVLGRWNPLADDGDALRLAVKLRLTVMVWSDGECASAAKTTPDGVPPSVAGGWQAESTRANDDISSATRRAIVRAAAEIGESMP